MERTKWVDRVFHLDIPPGWLPNIISRLDGVPMRIKQITSKLGDPELSKRSEKGWSIKEHIGHLIDLEELHSGRIQDFKDRKAILRAADMSNRKTYAADHNNQSLTDLISRFEKARKHFIAALKDVDDETQQFVAIHPRLKVEMRIVDMAFFTAEHDDHHIASIYELLEVFD